MSIFLFFSFLCGSIIGSYIAARTYRIIYHTPQTSKNRSQCPSCHHLLGIVELIPILSYLFQKGRCTHCKKKISIHYIIIECITALLFTLPIVCGDYVPSIGENSLIPFSALYLFLIWVSLSILLYISILDIYLQGFPVVGVSAWGICIFFLHIIGFLFYQTDTLLPAIIGFLFYTLLLWSIKVLGNIVYRQEVLGEGDIYIGGYLGILLGLSTSIMAFYVTIIIGGIFSAIILISQKKTITYQRIPFAPLLCIGAVIAFFFQDVLLSWYTYIVGI